MSDYRNDFVPTDFTRIDASNEDELIWWMRKLGVSYEQLRQAVDYVGPDSEKVAFYLNRTLPI